MNKTNQVVSNRDNPKTNQSASQSASNVLSPSKFRVTEGQLEAVAFRVRDELRSSLHRTGSAAHATMQEGVLKVEIEHGLSAAEHNLMRPTSGRNFLQRYIEKVAEQMYPKFTEQIESILPVNVKFSEVKVDGERDSIVFTFGIRMEAARWSAVGLDENEYRYNYA